MILKKVLRNKTNGQYYVYIPKDSGIKEGDTINITKMKVTVEEAD